jgi:hypothetical protein
MAAQMEVPTPDSQDHRLLSLNLNPKETEITVEDVSSGPEERDRIISSTDGVLLDLKLEKCVHGKLNDSGDLASLLVFRLEPVSKGDGIVRLTRPLTISLEFEREIPQEQDVVEILRTGQNRSLGADVSEFLPLVEIAMQTTTHHLAYV